MIRQAEIAFSLLTFMAVSCVWFYFAGDGDLEGWKVIACWAFLVLLPFSAGLGLGKAIVEIEK